MTKKITMITVVGKFILQSLISVWKPQADGAYIKSGSSRNDKASLYNLKIESYFTEDILMKSSLRSQSFK